MQVIYLPAAAELPADRIGDDAVVVLEHIGLHRAAVLRGFLDDRHIPDAAHGHVQRTGDRGGGQGEHVDAGRELLDPLLLRHTEALLLIDDEQPQAAEAHILRQHPVGADEDIDLASGGAAQDVLLLLRGAEAGDHLDAYREALKPLGESVIMLEGENGGRHKHHALPAL